MSSAPVSTLAFLSGGGSTGALMRERDWSESPLGPPDTWPQSLRSIVNLLLNSQFPMFVAWGPELGFLYNDAYSVIMGVKHPDALGRRFHDIWAEIWDALLPSIEQARHGNATYHENLPLTINRRGYDEQTWFTFSYSPVRDESGGVAGMFCAVTETTDQVLAERHRVQELNRLRRLFQQAPGLIAVLREPEHVYEIANDAYLRLVGRKDLRGLPIREALPELEGQGFFELLDQVYSTGEPYIGRETPVKLQRMPGGPLEERIVNFVFQPLVDHRGKTNGIFIEGNDVTEAVQAHRALQVSENELKVASRLKDEFLAMLAHELRNPLAPIATAAQILKFGVMDEARLRKTSEVITRQVGHMTELVDDLLDVSRVTRGLVTLQKESLSMNSVLADAAEQVRPLMEGKRQHLSVQAPQGQVFVSGDRTRLIQVFSNILNNAAKYTPQNGHVTLRVSADADWVTVSVEDDGIGIAPSLLPNIFDLFAQAERSPDRSQGGLGLGLALVKSLLELQGGEISARSEGIGRGSQFIARLPRVAASDAVPDTQSQTRPIAHAVRRLVAVVDDNKDAAEMLRFLLEAAGHEVLVSHSAQGALQLAQEHSPSILFLDIGLPDMDGYEVARRLRALPRTHPLMLVAVTGYGQPQDKEKARQAGFDHHLVKPARPEDVLSLIGEVRD